jgi:hypothetical protein
MRAYGMSQCATPWPYPINASDTHLMTTKGKEEGERKVTKVYKK